MPSWPTLRTSEGLVHVPADDPAWAAHSQAQNRRLSRCRRPSRTPRPKQFGWIATIIAVVGHLGLGHDEPNREPTEEPTAAGFTPRKSDFEIGIKILEKKCFGSAGCSLTYRIKPKYVGTQELN